MTFRYERVGMLFDVINGATPESGDATYWDGDIAWATPDDLGRLEGRELSATARRITQEGLASCATKIVPAGSLILSTRAPIGHVAIATMPMAFNQGCRALVPASGQISSKFAYYSLYASKARLQSEGQGTTFLELSRQRLRMIGIPVAPKDRQEAIVRFLDAKTAEIDTLIAKKRRLLDLLAEQRAALITRAVTKGLDSDAPLKSSGLPWVGDVPRQWTPIPLKRCLLSLRDGTHNPPPRADGDFRLLSARNIVDGEFVLREDDRTMIEDDFRLLERSYTVRPGDVVIVVVGATTGKSAVVEVADRCSVQRSVAILRPLPERATARYLHYWITSEGFQSPLRGILSKYAAQPGIYLEELGRMMCVLPPVPEQARISAFIDEYERGYRRSMQSELRGIDLLHEKRSATITAAVTGQIDVRNWSAKRAVA